MGYLTNRQMAEGLAQLASGMVADQRPRLPEDEHGAREAEYQAEAVKVTVALGQLYATLALSDNNAPTA